MTRKFIPLVLNLLFVGVVVSQDYQYDTVSRLMSDILVKNGYQKNVLPTKTPGSAVQVSFGMMLQAVEHLDDNTGILSTLIWINMAWNDNRLKWNESEYGGVTSIRIPPESLWMPDIIPYNVARPQEYVKYITDVVVDSQGGMLVVPPYQLHTYCSVDLSYYPYDQQTCTMKFGSWTYDGSSIDLQLNSDSVETSSYIPNKEWDLLSASMVRNVVQYECCVEQYIDITAKMTLQRRSGILFHVYLGPAVCTVLMIPAVFLLPPESNQKITLGGSLLISQVLILNMLPDSIPAAHDSPPYVVLFYLASIVLLCLSLACSVVVVSMWNRANRGGGGVPVVLNRIFLGIFGTLLCVGRDDFCEQKVTRSSSLNTDDEADRSNLVKDTSRRIFAAQWRQLAVVFDRLLLILFSVACLVIVITMFAFRP